MEILKEIFCQKLIVSNFISTFLDQMKPKIGQPWSPKYSAPLFQNIWIRPFFRYLHCKD